MTFLNEYATSIIITSLLATLLEALTPSGSNKKYIRVLIGLFVMLTILKPLTALPQFKASFMMPETQAEYPQPLPSTAYVAEAFEQDLAQAIRKDVQNSFGTTINCHVTCTVNENHQITEIHAVTLSPYSREIAKYLAEKYGIKEESITP